MPQQQQQLRDAMDAVSQHHAQLRDVVDTLTQKQQQLRDAVNAVSQQQGGKKWCKTMRGTGARRRRRNTRRMQW